MNSFDKKSCFQLLERENILLFILNSFPSLMVNLTNTGEVKHKFDNYSLIEGYKVVSNSYC